MAISNPSAQFGNSQFVVDPTLGVGSYTTIAAAIAAADAAGGGTVYIRPGSYTESLTVSSANNISLIGSTAALGGSVDLLGNQIFDGNGIYSLEGLNILAGTGNAVTFGNSGAGTTVLNMTNCVCAASAGIALVGVSAAGSANGTITNCVIDGSTQGATLANGDVLFESCTVTGGSSNAIELQANSNFTGNTNTLSASSASTILISSATASGNSISSEYTAALNSTIRFTANGSYRTVNEVHNSSNASGFFSDSSGAFGLFSYSYVSLNGTATGIDPQISAASLSNLSASPLVYNDVTGSQALAPGNRYGVSSGAVSLSLPAVSQQGDEIAVLLAGGTSWTITQGAGQQIRIGNTTTTLGAGGSLASTQQGDMIKLVCTTANLIWQAESTIGNLIAI